MASDLETSPGEASRPGASELPRTGGAKGRPRSRFRENLPYLLALGVLLVAVTVVQLTGDVRLNPSRPCAFPLPEQVGDWRGMVVPGSPEEKKVLPPDTELSKRLYRDQAGNEIFATLVVSGAEQRSLHQPEYCLPAQGWTISHSRVMEVPAGGCGIDSFQATRITADALLQVPGLPPVHRRLVDLYWFEGHGRSTPSHWQRMFWATSDRVLRRVNNRWGFISVITEVTAPFQAGGRTEDQALGMLVSFAGELRRQLIETARQDP